MVRLLDKYSAGVLGGVGGSCLLDAISQNRSGYAVMLASAMCIASILWGAYFDVQEMRNAARKR